MKLWRLPASANEGSERGTRFDWSVIIEHVDYRGHRFYAPLHVEHYPHLHDSVSGPTDEFAMFGPMGFAEAEPGDSFVKIGVGLLEKTTSKEYFFHGEYPLRRAVKTIDITHYNHNFTLIDGTPYGPDYAVEFAFATEEPKSIDNLACFRDGAIAVDAPLGDQSFWVELYNGPERTDYNAVTVRNQLTGAAVSFEGDAPVERMVFWAVERAACPEPFLRIRLDPGESASWSCSYRLSADEE